MDATRTTTLIDANQANAAAADAVVKAIVISDEQEEEEKRCPVLQALSVVN